MKSQQTSDFGSNFINQFYRKIFDILEDCQDVLDEEYMIKVLRQLQQFSQQTNNLIEIITQLFSTLINQIKSIKSKQILNIHQNDYCILEEAVQKSESEIRKHIRIQHQLKLYSDSLEQKIEAYEKTIQQDNLKFLNNSNLIKAYEKEKQQLINKIQILEQKYEGIEQKKIFKQQKSKLYHKNSKIMSQISFQQNPSLNNLKESIHFSFDYKKRRREMEKLRSKSKPISGQKDKMKEIQQANFHIVLHKTQQKQLLKKKNSMNLKQKQSLKYKPYNEMQKTVNCYEQNQKRSKLVHKKKNNQTYQPSLNKQTRCNSVCK